MDKKEVNSLSALEVTIEFIKQDISETKTMVRELSKRLDERFVTVDQFAPVKTVVYGLVALILSAVIGGLITLVIK